MRYKIGIPALEFHHPRVDAEYLSNMAEKVMKRLKTCLE